MAQEQGVPISMKNESLMLWNINALFGKFDYDYGK